MRKKIILVIVLGAIYNLTNAQNTKALKDSTKTSSIDEVTITSTGVKRNVKNFVGTVNIITNKQMNEMGFQSISDAARLIPGANYLDEDGKGLKPSIGLRGLDPNRSGNLLIVVDGKFPIGQSYSQLGAYYMMPMGPIETVEIIKGASPVLHGGGTIGGVMNLITKNGRRKSSTKIYSSYGSYQTQNSGIESSGDNGEFGYYAGYNRRNGEGFRTANSAFHTDDFTVQLRSQTNDKNEIKVYLNAFWERSETPGGLSQADFDENYRKTVNLHDVFIGKRFSTSISYKRTLTEESDINTALYGSYFIRDWWVGDKKGQNKNIGEVRNIPSGGLFVDYNNRKSIGSFKNNLLVGARLHGDITNQYLLQGNSLDARDGTMKSGTQSPTTVYEAYVYDEFSLSDQLTISPGLRFTHVGYAKKDVVTGGRASSSNQSLIYSLGGIYKPSEKIRIYGILSKGYQPPAIATALDLGTIAAEGKLDAETSNNYEIGIRSSIFDWLNVDLSGYLMYFDNKIISESGIYRNAGKSFHRGIEAEINVKPVENSKIYFSGALQKATFENGIYKDNNLPYAPNTIFTIGLRQSFHIGKSEIVANVYDTYTSKQFNDEANTVQGTADGFNGKIPAFNLLNASLNYYLGGLNVNVSVLNILDRHYFTQRFAYWNGIIPSPGRTLSVGCGYSF